MPGFAQFIENLFKCNRKYMKNKDRVIYKNNDIIIFLYYEHNKFMIPKSFNTSFGLQNDL